ncbi:hypothetical protein GCM10027047_27950 [Rhodococcus aerolatus]
MAQAITDAHVVSVLKIVVRGSGPVLDALTHTDPFGIKGHTRDEREQLTEAERRALNLKDKVVRKAVDSYYAAEFPGTAAWDRMDTAQRSDWWVGRVGRFTTLVASVPGLAGAVSDRFPVQSTVGSASQALVLVAVAREHGVTDQVEQVRLLAHVLTRRDVSRELVEGTAERSRADLEADGVPAEKEGRERGSALVRAGKAVWRYGRVLRSILGELDKRPQGRWYHRLLGVLPVVGAGADYLGERSALKRAVRSGTDWIGRHPDAHS